MTKTYGLIFVNTNFKGKIYNRDLIQQGQKSTKAFFSNIGISNIDVHQDLSYNEIVKVFKDLRTEMSQIADETTNIRNVNMIMIRWIGHNIEGYSYD